MVGVRASKEKEEQRGKQKAKRRRTKSEGGIDTSYKGGRKGGKGTTQQLGKREKAQEPSNRPCLERYQRGPQDLGRRVDPS